LSALPDTAAHDADDTLPWVVCLCAEWCGTCREYRPLFEAVARAHPRWRFAWVDIEDHAELADDFDVETFPTLLVAGAGSTHFLGPLLPHAETLGRLLSRLPAPEHPTAEVARLIEALERDPARWALKAGPTSDASP